MKKHTQLYKLIFVLIALGAAHLSHGKVLFKSNLDYNNGTQAQLFRIPSIVKVNKNNYLVAFAEERLGDNNDSGDINVVYRFSKNNGKTWSKIIRLCDLGKDTCGNPTAVVDQDTGVIHVWMNANKGNKWLHSKNPEDRIFKVGDRKILHTSGRFTSKGLRFREIRDFTSLMNTGETWDTVGPGVGIQIRRGKYKGRLIVPARRRVFYKDPNGRWKVSQRMRDVYGTESAIVELSDGTIFRSDRTNAKAVRRNNAPKRRRTSFSRDGGESFYNFNFDSELKDPHAQGSLLRYSRYRIIHANCNDELKRRNLTLRLTDDGIHWKKSKVISKDCGYSSMVRVGHGSHEVGILTERKAKDPKVRELGHGPKDLVFKMYTLEDLDFR